MGYYAKCSMGVWVMLPEGIEKAKGDQIPCPHECGCCSSTCFGAIIVKNRTPASFCKYSDQEVISVWKLNATPKVLQDDVHDIHMDGVATNKTHDPLEVGFSSEGENVSSEGSDYQSAFEAYANLDLFSNSTDDPQEELYGDTYNVPNLDSRSTLKVGGLLYTDNEILLRLSRNYSPLNNAFCDIVRRWDTKAVFANDDAMELSDDFKWLLEKKFSSHYSRQRIETILKNNRLSRSEKLFALFYGELFVWKKQDLGGFYWCDEDHSPIPLSPHFTDFNDFSQKYCEGSLYGQGFRTFVEGHLSSVLLYFNFRDRAELIDAVVEQMMRFHGRIVYVADGQTHDLGTMKEFVSRMHCPSDYKTMYLMCEFLKSYCASKDGIVKRNHGTFNCSVGGDEPEDDCRFNIFRSQTDGNPADKYNLYVSLLMEYIASFKPDKVKIGHLTFSADSFYKDLEGIVGNYCRDIFSRVTNDINLQHRNDAFLTLSLYQRNVFVPYYGGYDKKIADLISLLRSPTIETYYRIIEKPLVYKHNTEVPVSLGTYILDRIGEQKTLSGLVSVVNSNFVTAFTTNNKPNEKDIRVLRQTIQDMLSE